MKRAAPYLLGAVFCAAAVAALAVLPLATVGGYGTVWLTLDVVFIWYFVAGYGLLSRWFDTEVGVHLMLYSLAMALELSWLLYLRFTVGPTAYPPGLYAITTFYIMLTFLFGWRAVIFTRAQITARRRVHR